MGARITNNLLQADQYEVRHCEKGEPGIARLTEKGLEPAAAPEAVPQAEIVVLAVPDALIKPITAELVPLAQPGTTFLLLDPAAVMADEVQMRDDANYLVAHPCHPPLFGERDTPEARDDLFGGVAAEQNIVIALMQGSDQALLDGEDLCREMFAPVMKVHRITVQQMALLEPAMSEVVAAPAAMLIRDAMEQAIESGVPREAAEAFMLGHARLSLAIAFGRLGPFSDAAQIAIKWGRGMVIKPDWPDVFQPEKVDAVIDKMLHPDPAN
jgi:hypothetical protein